MVVCLSVSEHGSHHPLLSRSLWSLSHFLADLFSVLLSLYHSVILPKPGSSCLPSDLQYSFFFCTVQGLKAGQEECVSNETKTDGEFFNRLKRYHRQLSKINCVKASWKHSIKENNTWCYGTKIVIDLHKHARICQPWSLFRNQTEKKKISVAPVGSPKLSPKRQLIKLFTSKSSNVTTLKYSCFKSKSCIHYNHKNVTKVLKVKVPNAETSPLCYTIT